MPELPEVEVVRRGLEDHMVGHTIVSATVLHPRAARNQLGGGPEIEANIAGLRVSAAKRRGKFLWLELIDAPSGETRPDLGLLVHLGMSGQMLIKEPDAPISPHLRAKVELDNGDEVWFVDQRTFGYWWLGDLVDGVPERVSHIATDVLDESADFFAIARNLKSRKSEIKRLLLNQEIVSGIGNIYADEMLWQAKIHPLQRADRLSLARLEELLQAGKDVMTKALAQGGTSFDALYVNVNGNSGYFALSLNAYAQTGEPCGRCRTLIIRESFMNRGSHYCPNCQKRR
ncbi:bifunctional DNA-formamidopyrimidine glycosylase/DNA-(apurinic or apyrimidinic site) lyase [Corynebacterium glutamicum]|uniref:bifunctional DNA-formamidopyrimidine glycosylase/DNA-(apurinic or apyrimidinic site) lyase n=1 Tax=Corynebacterium glutamicum TaxID=1718 RepID=UPI000720A521|nr:bifunctional DNA-formamidopyrimidine glycosylase/DNA-(apurinic or apyrimidinic site) lyase [Corynebacterium glutamicum]ALP50523.1 formamidopyrimidine-DNA glycosylase [Corynebacterium glutamicum]ANU34044.1 DNA-formamidopyrimidine glycosylase [Corynebacterium glutamicum]QWQ84698.1 DNA-formamidopyrimidine glycosylase [Corynebacterium glutamicum]WFP72672.1 bifunctional DNA-formamidopyrimidine glycosylase/DNA-(apurinic or apyrimidinic site) lyase [Corynebacterium glutamicum]BCB32608.1 formamidop